jgi:TetR/AcrR family transcriptional repressor of nem operon
MGRPKKFDRDDALDLVMNEVWEHGYDACSVKAISEMLGITRSSFYNAFGSREELFLEVLKAYSGPSLREWFPINETCSVLKVISDKIHNICKARIDDGSARGCLAINSVIKLVGKHDQLGPVVEKEFSTNIKFFANLLAVAVERGELDKCDLHVKAQALQSLIVGLNVMSKLIRDADELWATTKHSLQGLGLHSE